MLYCQACGAEARSSFKFCPRCNSTRFGPTQPVQRAATAVVPTNAPTVPHAVPLPQTKPLSVTPHTSIDVSQMEYAGFWRRAAAWWLDAVFIVVPIWLVFTGLIVLSATFDTPWVAVSTFVVYMVCLLVLPWPYYALQESGVKQATWGKRIMGLVVCGMQGQRLTFRQASGRHAGRVFLPGFGYLWLLFSDRRQALHDKLSDSVVMYRGG